MAWTKKDIDNLTGKVKSVSLPKEPKKRIIIPNSVGKEKLHIEYILSILLKNSEIEDFEKEYKFDKNRKYRFDWAIPTRKIAIEYEGVFSKKSRHTTFTGYTNDCKKYNLATSQGWKVLRYTALNYLDIEKDLNIILSL